MKTTDADEKKNYVLRELCETERSFLTVLRLISQDFFSALCELVTAEDVELLFSTAKVGPGLYMSPVYMFPDCDCLICAHRSCTPSTVPCWRGLKKVWSHLRTCPSISWTLNRVYYNMEYMLRGCPELLRGYERWTACCLVRDCSLNQWFVVYLDVGKAATG